MLAAAVVTSVIIPTQLHVRAGSSGAIRDCGWAKCYGTPPYHTLKGAGYAGLVADADSTYLQIGFAVALVCEGFLPRAGQQGFFGQDSPQTLWILAACAAAVICTAVVSLIGCGFVLDSATYCVCTIHTSSTGYTAETQHK